MRNNRYGVIRLLVIRRVDDENGATAAVTDVDEDADHGVCAIIGCGGHPGLASHQGCPSMRIRYQLRRTSMSMRHQRHASALSFFLNTLYLAFHEKLLKRILQLQTTGLCA